MGYEISTCEMQYDANNKERVKKIHASYTLEGAVLENVESIKYLGVTITNDLRWNTHVSNMRKTRSRMRKTRSDTDIRKYKDCKKNVQKSERQSYWYYVNRITEVGDQDGERPSKQKRFCSYIKSLRKDSTGIAPLKDSGRLFNTPKDKADILNRKYISTFTRETIIAHFLILTVYTLPSHGRHYCIRRWCQKITIEE